MAAFKAGDLVEPTESVAAAYSGYGLNPKMHFEPGMVGVVRHVDSDGTQVEFFHPETGCIEAVRTKLLKAVKWPGDPLPKDTLQTERGWWFCGSLDWKGALELLRVASEIRPDYFLDLTPETLRIPGVHGKRIRKLVSDRPRVESSQYERVRFVSTSIAELIQLVELRSASVSW